MVEILKPATVIKPTMATDLSQEEDGGMQRHVVTPTLSKGGIIIPAGMDGTPVKQAPPDPFQDIRAKLGKGQFTASDIQRITPQFFSTLCPFEQDLFRRDMETALEDKEVCTAVGNILLTAREKQRKEDARLKRRDKAKRKAERKRGRRQG